MRSPADQLRERTVERLELLVEVEELIPADRAFPGGPRQSIRVLRLLQQENGDEANAAIGAGDLHGAVAVTFVQQIDLAVGQGLRAGEAFVVFGALFDQRDQVH